MWTQSRGSFEKTLVRFTFDKLFRATYDDFLNNHANTEVKIFKKKI